jgi:hypothetical protein
MTCPATLRLPTLALSLLLLLTGSLARADQLYINGMLFRDGDSVVRLLQHAGPPLWVSQLGYRCDEHYYRYWRHRHNSCRYRRLVERWTYIDDGKEIRITVVDDTIDAIDWKFEGHRW